MKILAIETSCDDTGIAILEASDKGDFKVLSNIVASQIEIHKQYGGVYPAMAKREHEKNLPPTLETALAQAKISMKDIDLIAITNGPGLEPCLWVGVNFAKDLSKKWNIPVVPVNHIEGHILVNFLNIPCIHEREYKVVKFPAVCLVVSGGHTQIILMKGIGKYKILGETRDDAAGECFDKAARILGLGYPGGPVIAKLAATQIESGRASPLRGGKIALPRPMINTKDYDFSFSGLKTAVLYAWQKQQFFASRQKTANLKVAFAKEIQQAIIDVLIKKTLKAAKDYKAKTVILGGGVSANKELRRQFQSKINTELCGFLPRGKKPHAINFLIPRSDISTDNAVMTAITGYFHRNKKVSWKKLKADANLRISK